MRCGRKIAWTDNPNGCGPAFVKAFARLPKRMTDGGWVWWEPYYTRWVDLGHMWTEFQWENRAQDDPWVSRVGIRPPS